MKVYQRAVRLRFFKDGELVTDKKFKENILLITYAAILLALFFNVSNIVLVIKKMTTVMAPFIYGFIIAYIINWPYTFLFNKFYKMSDRCRKTVSIIFSYAFMGGIIAFLIGIIVPQVVNSLTNIVNIFSIYYPEFENWLNQLPYSDQIKQIINKIIGKWDTFSASAFTSVFAFTKDFTLSLYNWIIGFIISVYMLSSKQKLLSLIKRIISVCLPKHINEYILEISSLMHCVFGKFIKGKVLDSFIIGVICFLGMSIFKMPYSVLISVIVGFTNVIPFFGPFMGAIPSVLIMLVVNPVKAIWFAVFILVLQQVDGNIIGPKILGDSVGISGIFIILSVLIGGGLFGVPGMILGVPVFAVIYILIGRLVKKKEKLSA